MSLREFLMTKTEQGDICMIFQDGFPAGMTYIDREKLMPKALPKSILSKEVIDFDKGKFGTSKGQVIDVLNIEIQGESHAFS